MGSLGNNSILLSSIRRIRTVVRSIDHSSSLCSYLDTFTAAMPSTRLDVCHHLYFFFQVFERRNYSSWITDDNVPNNTASPCSSRGRLLTYYGPCIHLWRRANDFRQTISHIPAPRVRRATLVNVADYCWSNRRTNPGGSQHYHALLACGHDSPNIHHGRRTHLSTRQ